MPPQPSASEADRAEGRKHLQAVEDHVAHGDFLKATGRTDVITIGWAITALFYSAVHALRAYLRACKGVTIASHDDFHTQQRIYPELNRTKVEYDLLKQESQSARYYCGEFTWEDFDKLRAKANKVANTWRNKTNECIGSGC